MSNPIKIVQQSLDALVLVEMKGDREMIGSLQGFDQHLNLMLTNATETHSTVSVDTETSEETFETKERFMDSVYIRGDTVILVSPYK